MIQVIGVASIVFTKSNVSFDQLNNHLNNTLERHSIIESTYNNQVSVKFIMKMKCKQECKTIDDYNSYIFNDFNKLLPKDCEVNYIKAYNIQSVNPSSMKHISDFIGKIL